jgi:3-deoxy-D-manno-octulosonic acid kinase
VRRGVATPAPVALLLVDGPGPLCRAWLAVDEIDHATDLAARFASVHPPTRAELGQVMGEVRKMHDVGVEHRDLNLGNLLLRTEPDSEPRAWVLDLDRARLHTGPLRFRLRQRALRRLERSHLKLFGDSHAAAPRDLFYELYASGDEELGRRLDRGRSIGRLLLRLHRTGRY